MISALSVFTQNDGEVTREYYRELSSRGVSGRIAVALFRAQKRSSRAKDYRRGKWRRAAYDVKSWSIDQLTELLAIHGSELKFSWGWKADPSVVFGEEPSWVLYCDIPGFGQCSFHSPSRGKGPDYAGDWDGQKKSADRIIQFCDYVMRTSEDATNENRNCSSSLLGGVDVSGEIVPGHLLSEKAQSEVG